VKQRNTRGSGLVWFERRACRRLHGGEMAWGFAAAVLIASFWGLPASSRALAQSTSPGPNAAPSRVHRSFSAIQIEPVDPNGVTVPPAFRVAVYENLIEQVRKTGKFAHVYRSGDRAASDAPGLAVLRMKVEGFREGSEMKRTVTTVTGFTSIKMSLQVVTRDGQVVVDQSVEGRVRFLGENLRATYDFAKKASKILNQNL